MSTNRKESLGGQARRTIPGSHENGFLVKRKPIAPVVETRSVGLSTFTTARNVVPDGLARVKPDVKKSKFNGSEVRETKGATITPLIRQPLTNVFTSRHGGGRVGGGGTSEEALRRAKKKQVEKKGKAKAALRKARRQSSR